MLARQTLVPIEGMTEYMLSSSTTRFVICGRPEVDLIVARDMRIVTAAVLRELGAVDAIILEGSFGRGEGAAVQREGRWIPVNDYDLCIITEQSVGEADLGAVKRTVLGDSDIRRVDISTISREELRSLKPRMLNFDRKYGSQVIHGNTKVLNLIPEMRPEDIPLFEAEKELFSRVTSFVVSFDTSYCRREIPKLEAFRLRQQLAKALIACANASLILKGQYRASMLERAALFEAAVPFDRDTMTLIGAAFRFKANPELESRVDPLEYYFECRDLYLQCFLDLVRSMYGRDFPTWGSYARSYLRSPRNLAMRLQGWWKRDSTHYRQLHLNLAQLFLVAGLKRDGTMREEERDWARHCLSQAGTRDERRIGWDELRLAILALRM